MMCHCLLLLLLGLQGSPGPTWTFHDDLERDGRSMVSFRTMELIDKPVRAMHTDDQPPPGSKFGLLTLGCQQKTALPLVWHQATRTLWIKLSMLVGCGKAATR